MKQELKNLYYETRTQKLRHPYLHTSKVATPLQRARDRIRDGGQNNG